ncbi:MAG TPA: hypothetical protein VIH42_07650 [Thermoguttaceae bacterium]
MSWKLIPSVFSLAMMVCAHLNAQERTAQPAPTVSEATDEELAQLSKDTSLLQNMFLLPEVGTGWDPSYRHDCGAFALHGLFGEAGWFYQNKGYRSMILWRAGQGNGAVKYKAIDGNGKLWVFLVSEDEVSLGAHEIWIDDDPSDAIAPIHFEWAVEAK